MLVERERWLLIDDVRTYNVDRICRTASEGKKALFADGPWDVLMLDNDLGWETNPATGAETFTEGWEILEWALAHKLLPPRVQLVTSNSSARTRMILALQKEGYKPTQPGNQVDWTREQP